MIRARRTSTKLAPGAASPATRGSRPNALLVCILAGGLSSRMGRNKSLLRIRGRTLIGHIRWTTRGLGLPVLVIRRDIVPRCGPLGGIYTGLQTSRAKAALFLACDMPFVQPALLQQMVEQFRKNPRPIFSRVADTAGFPCIIPSSKTSMVQKCIGAKHLSIQKLASRLRADFIDVDPADSAQLLNINTPRDLELARKMARATACKWHC